MQQDESASPDGDASPDSQDRIRDFLTRHGGQGSTTRTEKHASGEAGWYEVYAADGYRLRCDWSRMGDRREFKFSEIGPRAR